jgi:flagellar motor switch protein FliN/FliY
MSDQFKNASADPDTFLGGIPVEVVVELGRKTMLIREVAALKPGDIVDLEQTVDSPLDIRVGDKLLAKGELVMVNGRVGLRVTEMPGRRGAE